MTASLAELAKRVDDLTLQLALVADPSALVAEAIKTLATKVGTESGTWTPVLTFATTGDLSVTYSIQAGSYIKIGSTVFITCTLLTASFTHTTASGGLRITGLPFTSNTTANAFNTGSLVWQGITKASYTDISCRIQPNSTVADFIASGSGVLVSEVAAADMPTAGSVLLETSLVYRI